MEQDLGVRAILYDGKATDRNNPLGLLEVGNVFYVLHMPEGIDTLDKLHVCSAIRQALECAQRNNFHVPEIVVKYRSR